MRIMLQVVRIKVVAVVAAVVQLEQVHREAARLAEMAERDFSRQSKQLLELGTPAAVVVEHTCQVLLEVVQMAVEMEEQTVRQEEMAQTV